MCLNTWSLSVELFGGGLESLGSEILLEEVCHCGWDLSVVSPGFQFSFCFVRVMEVVNVHFVALVTLPATFPMLPCLDELLYP